MAQKKIAFKCVPGSATISERDSRQSIFVVLSGLTQADTKADQDVIQSLFLIGIRLYERCREHRAAAAAAAGPYVPPTDAMMIDWTTSGNANADDGLVNHFTMLGATFATKYAMAKINGAAAGMAAQRTATRKLWLQQANTYLVQQLLQSIEKHDSLRHLKDKRYVEDSVRQFYQITDAMAENVVTLSSVKLLTDCFLKIVQQTSAVNSNLTALFEPPDIYGSLSDHREKSKPGFEVLRGHQFADVEAVFDHLEAQTAANFVATIAVAPTVPREYKDVYTIVADQIIADGETDPTPLTMVRFEKFATSLRTTLESRGLQLTVPRPKAGGGGGKRGDPSPQHDTGDVDARLRALEQKQGAQGDGRRDRLNRRNRRRGPPDRSPSPPASPSRVCFSCGASDHVAGSLSCPKIDPKAKRMIEEKEKANKLRQLSKKVEEADDFEDTEEGVARGGVGAVNVAKYSLPQSPPNLHIPASLSWRVEIPWSVKAVSSSSVHQSRLLHSPQAICTIPASSPLVTTTSRPSLRSACHDDSVVHLYQSRFKIARPAGPQTRFGAVMDTGAQRGATANVDDIVKITDETLTMQPALGDARQMKGILMGAETVTAAGNAIVLVIPDVSVHSPDLSDSLVPVGRLMEADFDVRFRLPKHAQADGYPSFPRYGGTIRTPNDEVIVMEYARFTWRLPLPPQNKQRLCDDLLTSNSFFPLTDDIEDAAQLHDDLEQLGSRRSEKDQQKFELMCRRQREARIAHESHGHCNNRQTLLNMEAKGQKVKHLKRYILAHTCEHCYANIGRRHYKTKRRTADGDLGISTITDAELPGTTITESLARIFERTAPFSSALYPLSMADEQELSDPALSDITRGDDDADCARSVVSEQIAQKITELKALRRQLNQGIRGDSALTSPSPYSPPGTDLRMDWADACSLGRLPDLNRYFLLIVDKGTEYFAAFPAKNRKNPLELLKAYIATTGKKPRYLRVDGAKEFATPEMENYCIEHGIILQVVVAYNHTMQARVEAAIGCVKQHSRISLLTCGAPTRFWDDATVDFTIKKNFLWATEGPEGVFSTAHDRMQPAFSGTLATVAIPFGCRILARLPREHRLVKNGSFGDRFVEGVYLQSDTKTPCIYIYVFATKSRMLVQDFQAFPEDYPFRHPQCLTRRSDQFARELQQMRSEDAYDDDLIAQELALEEHTVEQEKAVTRASAAATASPAIDSTLPTRASPLTRPDPTISAPKPRPLIDADIPLDVPLSQCSEISVARALLKHQVAIPLPDTYAPGNLPAPNGDMVVVGTRVQTLSKKKACLWVRFVSPPSLLGREIQLYPRSLEPKSGAGKGADFSILTALSHTRPNASTLADLGVRSSGLLSWSAPPAQASTQTRALLAAFDSMQGGTRFCAGALVDDVVLEPSDISHPPAGYTRDAPDPKHRGQAMRSPLRTEWIKSEDLEMSGLWRRGVFERVRRASLLPADKVFSSRFHYKIKRKGGDFDKCKVRLVVQGQHMFRKDINGVGDYEDAFSPVPHASGFRTILSLATAFDMHMDHVDISQAFVQGELLPGDGHNGNVYISPPPGYDEDPAYVYRLRRPLYGMPSAARAWFKTMSAFLKSEGCSTVGFEGSMWTCVKDGHRVILGAHIDDFIICCANRSVLDEFRIRLLDTFEGTYEGEIKHYLGCQIDRDKSSGTTTLSQASYSQDVLRTFDHWDDTIPCLTPFPPNNRLSAEDCDKSPDPRFHRKFRGIVGSLGYLVNMTRPDLAWAYSELSKFVQYPGAPHMEAALHVLRYLRGTYDKSIVYTRSNSDANVLWGWVDADWAGDTETRRSHTGYVLMLNGGAISWKSRRQDSVALSTSEAEYMAASQCGQDVLYLREMLSDFNVPQAAATRVYEDNLACIAMSENPVRRKYSRHIDIRRYFVRELVLAGVMQLIPLRTDKMVADALTKSLPSPSFVKHREVMLGRVPFAARALRSRGG